MGDFILIFSKNNDIINENELMLMTLGRRKKC